jgi:archaeal cell division control protein 6
MSLFENMLSDGESLFRDEDVLSIDYLPDILPYRENQQAYIAECIKPLSQGRAGKNLLISGAPGIGKTSCTRFVFKELEAATSEIKPLFINCWKKQTTNAVLLDMARQMGVVGAQFKSNEDLWEQIFKALSRFKGIVIALDEVDQAKDYDFLYQLAENLKRFTLVMITNEKDFLAGMDSRIKSRLVVEELMFAPYKRHEIDGILKERREVAFIPGAWTDEAAELVNEKCAEKNDVRIGLALLREAGREAERNASKKITVEHVMKCKSGFVDMRIGELDSRDKRVFDTIRANQGIETGSLVKRLTEEGLDIPDSTLRRVLQRLDKGGYIFREQAQTEGGGNTMKHYTDE